MSQVITNAFEQYWQSSLAAEQPVVLDEFVLADIPNLDITSPIDPDTGLPPESQIVHRQTVDQRGRINNNAVAYTIVMDTTVGDFSFNAMYLRNKANGVIGMIVYKGRETKLKTDQTIGQTGNSLVKSMLMGYDQAAEATLTNVDAGTWQIDYAARLRGQDEDLRQLASQLYGHHTFIGDGFKVVQQDGAHQVTQGVAIVGGLRIELDLPEVIYPGTKPIGIWVDAYRAGSLLSEHQNHFTIITSVADLTDHVDGNGYQHYVAKLAHISADGSIQDAIGSNSRSGGLGGTEVTAESFGVVSGLVSLPVARTNAYRIMNKAAELSAEGGGKIIFTKSLYQVHMDETDFDSSSANFRVGALKLPYDNVILQGQGWFSTTIQAYATNSSYEVVQWSKSPLQNGVTNLQGVGLHEICIDGNYHGDYTPASYVRQCAGVRGAGIKGLSISRLRVINTSHYGMGLQNGGYIGCSIDGYWSENTGADGLDIKDNEGVSRAFKLNNIIVMNFGQLDEPANPWAGLDVMSVAPEISNVYISDFGDKGAIDAGFRLKNGTEGMTGTRGTGGIFANASSVTVVQNRFKASPSTIIGVDFRACNVNYANIVVRGTGTGRIGGGISLEERYCQGVNVQISKVITGYSATNGSSPTDRNYGDAEGCSVTNITIDDATTAVVTTRKHQRLTSLSLKDCVNGLTSNGPNAGPVTVIGLYLENVTNPFGGLATSQNVITGIHGPGSTNYQAGMGIFKDGAGNLAATTILSKNGVRAYVNSTEVSAGTEVARFAAASSMILAPLIVTGAVQPSVANSYLCGVPGAPWSGGNTQTAFITTSDERLKTSITDLFNGESGEPTEEFKKLMTAWLETDFFMYQFIDRVEKKGPDGARWHFGIIAQRAIAAVTRQGLDWTKYSIFNYDRWDDVYAPEVELRENPENGEQEEHITGGMTLVLAAGDRYSINYEEALILDTASQRWFNKSILTRLEALEAN